METRTNIVLDDDLVARAMAKAGVSTKKAAIDVALRAYVREPDWQGLLALAGSGVLADDYDPANLFIGAQPRNLAAAPLAAYAVQRSAAVEPPTKRIRAAAKPRRK